MVAAWIRAETGVGPAMASGSQTYKGSWADLPATPTKRNKVMKSITPGATEANCPAWAKTPANDRSLNHQNMVKPATRNPKSPMRLVIKAFRAAFELANEGRPRVSMSYQKPMSRKEHSPTPSQPTKSMRYESPLTRIIIMA